VVAAASGLVRDATQISLTEPLNSFRVDGTLFTPSLALLLSGSSIYGHGFEKGCLVVIEDVRLRTADGWIYPG
jgi:hypothetical protein